MANTQTASNPFLDTLNTIGNAGGSIINSPLVGLLGLIPGMGNLMKSPAFQNMQARAEGQRLTSVLQNYRPNYATMDVTRPTMSLDGKPVNLTTVGNLGLQERQASYQQGLQEEASQNRVVRGMQTSLGDLNNKSEALDQTLMKLGPQISVKFNQAMQTARSIGTQASTFLKMGLNQGAALLQMVKSDQSKIRANFNNEVTSRMESLASGIDASTNAGFQQHVSALESAGAGLSGEEREALRMVYDRDGARSKAVALGSLHEAAMQTRAAMETQLDSTLGSMAQFTGSQAANLISSTEQAYEVSGQLVDDLTKAHVQSMQELPMMRTQLMQITNMLKLDGQSKLFDAVTNTVRPVAVTSDLFYDLFQDGLDALSYNNNIQTQQLSNEMAIQNPLHEGIFQGMGILERSRQMNDQMTMSERASGRALAGSGIQAVGSIFGGALSGG